jgi:hypothetical protein
MSTVRQNAIEVCKLTGKQFRVKASGIVGVCIGRECRGQKVFGNTRSRRQADPARRPSSRKLWLRFDDGTEIAFGKHELEQIRR